MFERKHFIEYFTHVGTFLYFHSVSGTSEDLLSSSTDGGGKYIQRCSYNTVRSAICLKQNNVVFLSHLNCVQKETM